MTAEDILLVYDMFGTNPVAYSYPFKTPVGNMRLYDKPMIPVQSNYHGLFDSDTPEAVDDDYYSNYTAQDADRLRNEISSLSKELSEARAERERWIQKYNCMRGLDWYESSLKKCGFTRDTIRRKRDEWSRNVASLEQQLNAKKKELNSVLASLGQQQEVLQETTETQALQEQVKKEKAEKAKATMGIIAIVVVLVIIIGLAGYFVMKRR